MKQSKNQYDVREAGLKKILNTKYSQAKQTYERSYVYANEIKQSNIEPIVYSKLRPKKPQAVANKNYLQLFFNDKIDKRYFMYTMVPLIIEKQKKEVKKVPTPKYAQNKNIDQEIDEKYYPVIQTGYLTAKKYREDGADRTSTLAWNNYFYALRRFTYYFYSGEVQESQIFDIEITEKALDKNMENLESFGIEEDFYVKKDEKSAQFRKMVEQIVFFRSYQMVCSIDNIARHPSVAEFENGSLDLSLDFRKRTRTNQRKTKQFKESLHAFLLILLTKMQRRTTRFFSLFLPSNLSHLSSPFPTRGAIESLTTNMMPSRSPLQELILNNLEQPLFDELASRLKDIFPKLDVHKKRTLSLTNSELNDGQLERILQKLSWPMDSLIFSRNKLSSIGVIALIESSKKIEVVNLDWSYNEPCAKIVSDSYIKYMEASPSIKLVKMRGCFVESNALQWFFQAIKVSLWVQEIEMDFHSEYGKYVSSLKDFQALMIV